MGTEHVFVYREDIDTYVKRLEGTFSVKSLYLLDLKTTYFWGLFGMDFDEVGSNDAYNFVLHVRIRIIFRGRIRITVLSGTLFGSLAISRNRTGSGSQ